MTKTRSYSSNHCVSQRKCSKGVDIMRFDPDNRQYIFSTEKHMDVPGVRAQLSEKKRRLREEQRTHPDKKGAPMWAPVLAAIVFIGAVAGIIIAAKSGHPAAAVCIFGGMFVAGGFAMIPKTRAGRERSNATNRVAGPLLMLVGLSVSVPMFLTDNLGSERTLPLLCAGMFASVGLLFLVHSLLRIYGTSNSCGLPIEGRCIGYAHMIVDQRGSHVESAEVFEYDYSGEHYESVNEVFRREADAEIGETVTMRLNPRIPSEVFYAAPRKGRNTGNFILAAFSACVLAIGVVFGILTLNGTIGNGGSGQSISANGKHVLNDAVIEKKIGDHETPWEVSLYTVMEKYEEDGVYYLRFSNKKRQSAEKTVWEQYELHDAYYFVQNTGTDKIIGIYKYKEWDYQGSHPLSDLREE